MRGPAVPPTTQANSGNDARSVAQPSRIPIASDARHADVPSTGEPAVLPARDPAVVPAGGPAVPPATTQAKSGHDARSVAQPSPIPIASDARHPDVPSTVEPAVLPTRDPAVLSAGGPAVVPAGGPAVVPVGGPAVVPVGGPAVVPVGGPAVVPVGGPAVVPVGGPAVLPAGGLAVLPARHPGRLSAGVEARTSEVGTDSIARVQDLVRERAATRGQLFRRSGHAGEQGSAAPAVPGRGAFLDEANPPSLREPEPGEPTEPRGVSQVSAEARREGEERS